MVFLTTVTAGNVVHQKDREVDCFTHVQNKEYAAQNSQNRSLHLDYANHPNFYNSLQDPGLLLFRLN